MGVHVKADYYGWPDEYIICPVTDAGKKLLDGEPIALSATRSKNKDSVVSEIVRQLNILADLQRNETRDRAVREANRVANKLRG